MKWNSLFPVTALSAILLTAACKSGSDKGNSGDTTQKKPDSIGLTKGVKINGQSFMMPSPMQIATIIKKSGALYNKAMLNPSGSLSKYSDVMKRSLNLGVYGADLGYITMYDNTSDAMEYYKTVVQLGDQLKITGSFDPGLMKRFSDNVGKKDSILSLVGEAYRRSDNFLKENDQDNVAALILAGGWVESMNFSLNVYQQKPNQEIAVRIGEQKHTSAGIVSLLQSLNKPEYGDLVKLFQDLSNEYQKIDIKYTFAEPTNDEVNHLTTINGKTDVNITPDELKALSDKVTAIRNYIIN